MQIKLRQIAFITALFVLSTTAFAFKDTPKGREQTRQEILPAGKNCVSKSNIEMQSSCERVKQVLDLALVEAQKATDAKLIFVSRLGKKERSKTLNQRRMTFIKNYLFNTKSGAIEKEAVVFQEGKRSEGLGEVEIYLRGDLIGELSYPKNIENACKSGTD